MGSRITSLVLSFRCVDTALGSSASSRRSGSIAAAGGAGRALAGVATASQQVAPAMKQHALTNERCGTADSSRHGRLPRHHVSRRVVSIPGTAPPALKRVPRIVTPRRVSGTDRGRRLTHTAPRRPQPSRTPRPRYRRRHFHVSAPATSSYRHVSPTGKLMRRPRGEAPTALTTCSRGADASTTEPLARTSAGHRGLQGACNSV